MRPSRSAAVRPVLAVLVVFYVLLSFPSAAAAPARPGIPVTGQVSATGAALPKDSRALLFPLLPDLEGARLELEGKATGDPVASAALAADGSFRLEAPESGMWKVVVQAPGFLAQEHLLLPLVEEADLPPVQLERDVKLEVRVTGPDGRPVAGARVRVGADPRSSQSRGAGVWRSPSRMGLTDAQGVLVLPRGAEESLVLRAGAAGFPLVMEREVRAASVAVRLPAGRARQIRVVDAAGKPVAGALVRLGELGWAGGFTSPEGLFEVPLAEKSEVRVLASMGDGRAFVLPLKPAGEKETGPQELRLPTVETLSGRVLSKADGRPVAGAVVWSGSGNFRRTGADGSYQLTAQPNLPLRLEAAAAGFLRGWSDLNVKPGATQGPSFALEPAVAVAGLVVDEQGKPVADVEIRSDAGNAARTSAAGRFRLAGLQARLAYKLRLVRKGYAPAVTELPPQEAGRPAADLRIVLRRGRTGFGRVVNQAEEPVAGAEVILESAEPGAPMWMRRRLSPEERAEAGALRAATDANGRFEIADLPPGNFDLTAQGRGYASLTVPGLSVPEGGGSTDLGTLVLPPGVVLEGFVVDPQGRAVKEARVFVTPAEEARGLAAPPTEAAAMTGPDGFFRVEDRRAGETVRVDVQRSGYAAASAPGVQIPREAPLRIVLQPSGVLEGRTVDQDGRPVAGARVSVLPVDQFSPALLLGRPPRATSEEDGSFRIEAPPGSLELRAMAEGRQSSKMVRVELQPGQTMKGIEVVLPAGAVVEGRVLSPRGTPVAGAEVGLVFSQMTREAAWSSVRVTADGEGRYRLEGVPPGPQTFQAEHPGYRRAARDLSVQAGENTLDFSLEGGGEIRGRVVDDAGAPVSSAMVFLREDWRTRESGLSGADGSFTLSGLADGTYHVVAQKEGYAAAEEGEAVTVEGGSAASVVVRLSVGGAIVGQLSGLEFTDLPRVRIWADSSMPSPGRVSPDGTYRLDNVAPGERRVTASLGGERQASGTVTLEPGVPEVRLDLEFKQGLRLTVRVLRAGRPAAGEHVSLSRTGSEVDSGEGRTGQTNHEGRFRFEGLEAGTYELSMMSRSWRPSHRQTVELSGDREVLVELSTTSISGRVVDQADRSPLSGAALTLVEPDAPGSGFFGEVASDARGQFRLADVAEGSWKVRAVLAGYAPKEVEVQVSEDSPVEDLEIALEATEGITVDILLPSGGSPDHARIQILDAAGRVVTDSSYNIGENGRVRISSVAPGAWELLVDVSPWAIAAMPVVAPGHAGRVVLSRAGTLEVTVPDTSPAEALTLRLTDASGRPFRAPWMGGTSEIPMGPGPGTYTFQRLPPGAWTLTATAPDGRTWKGSATITPGGTAQATLK